MILFAILLNTVFSHACYEGRALNACIEGNRAKADALFAQRDACNRDLKTNTQALRSAQEDLQIIQTKIRALAGPLELTRAELAFLVNPEEDEPSLFSNGPRFSDLPQFQKATTLWNEVAGRARGERLKAEFASLEAEQAAFTKQEPEANEKAAKLQAANLSIKQACDNFHNGGQHHVQLIDTACSDRCPTGPNRNMMF
jgi:hypothetical protein